MDKTYKPVYIKCTERNKGKRIIETLENLGGVNTQHLKGEGIGNIYYIKPDRKIEIIDPDLEYKDFVNYFLSTAKEIKTPVITAEYCYILGYGLGKIFEHLITEDEINLTTEEIFNKHGLNEDECSIMYATDKLNLEPLED